MNSKNENETNPPNLPLSLVPFAIQLQNVFPVDIVARRFPVDFGNEIGLNFNINITNLSIDSENQQAQVIVDVKVEPASKPRSFEIQLQIVGFFTYPQKYSSADVQTYLQSGSISALFPFIREYIWSLSAYLQIPSIMLPIIQLAAPENKEQPE